MGSRTVVVLYNDQTTKWENDPALGRKISIGMNYTYKPHNEWDNKANLPYGRVVECAHADTQTLAVIDGYQFRPIAHSSWYSQEAADPALKLLKIAAENLGYRLVKIPAKD